QLRDWSLDRRRYIKWSKERHHKRQCQRSVVDTPRSLRLAQGQEEYTYKANHPSRDQKAKSNHPCVVFEPKQRLRVSHASACERRAELIYGRYADKRQYTRQRGDQGNGRKSRSHDHVSPALAKRFFSHENCPSLIAHLMKCRLAA